MKISEFSLIDDEVRVFQINIKLSSNLVVELKNPRKRFTLPVRSLKNYGPLNSQATGKGKK